MNWVFKKSFKKWVDLSVEKMKDIMSLFKYLEPENRDFYIKYFNQLNLRSKPDSK
jgi:hypothetical protein